MAKCVGKNIKIFYLNQIYLQQLQGLKDPMLSSASWKIVEDFLRSVVDKNLPTLNQQCVACEGAIADPVQLPCRHVGCYPCLSNLLSEQGVCPLCQMPIPPEFTISTDRIQRETKFHLGENNRKCISFFMEIVTKFCFARDDSAIVDDDVIENLMNYVICPFGGKTKILSPINNLAIDPTPVVRSFMLQQLLKRKVGVEVHLQQYFQRSLLLAGGDKADLLNICKLIMYCLEVGINLRHADSF